MISGSFISIGQEEINKFDSLGNKFGKWIWVPDSLDIFWPAFESSIAFIQDQLDCRPTKDEDKFVRSVNGLLLISC